MRAALPLLVLLALVLPEAHARKSSKSRFPPVRLYHVNFRKDLRFALYDSKGFPKKSQMKRLERHLRCHHTGKRHGIHWRLQQLIYKVARHFPVQRLEVVSGYRHPRIARRKGVPKSYHTRGRALDFRVPGVPNSRLKDYLRSFRKVGVGYYPNSTFVHLDVRDKRSAYWVDESGPENGVAKKPEKDLEKEPHQTAEPEPSSPPPDAQASRPHPPPPPAQADDS